MRLLLQLDGKGYAHIRAYALINTGVKQQNYDSHTVVCDKHKPICAFELRNNDHLALTRSFVTMHGFITICTNSYLPVYTSHVCIATYVHVRKLNSYERKIIASYRCMAYMIIAI